MDETQLTRRDKNLKECEPGKEKCQGPELQEGELWVEFKEILDEIT